jgi:hypothetical protein
MLLGAGIAFKFIPATLAVFGLWIGWRRFALSAFATFVILQLVSAVIYPSIFVEYWTSAIFTIPEFSHYSNLSFIGLARRADSASALLLKPVAYLLSGAMLITPFILTWRARDTATQWSALVLLISATVTAAPVVESHYMTWLILPIWVLLCTFIRLNDGLGLALLGAIVVLLSVPYRLARTFLAVVPTGWDSEVTGEVVLTLGALLLFVLLLTTSLGHGRTAARTVLSGAE